MDRVLRDNLRRNMKAFEEDLNSVKYQVIIWKHGKVIIEEEDTLQDAIYYGRMKQAFGGCWFEGVMDSDGVWLYKTNVGC